MNIEESIQDLIILTADKNMRFGIESLLKRPESLGIKLIKTKVYDHPERDPGCFLRSDLFLQPFHKLFKHAIVIFDREGCGQQQKSRQELETEVTGNLSKAGWGDRANTIVIDPELENWVFSDSPELDAVIGWAGKDPSLRSWLLEKKFITEGEIKPARPKEALESALKQIKSPRSSSLYAQLAQKVSFRRCNDPSFIKFKETLQRWFSI